jgi:hypothetical protein
VCQLDELRTCLKPNDLREALKSLPETLDETYGRILDNINKNKRHSKDAFKILQWLAYSARPLRIEEVAEVIAVDIEGDPRFDPENRLREPRDILTICSSLVTITAEAMEGPHGKTAGEQVRLAHFSVKEYLVSERSQVGQATRYSIQEIPANGSIAEICLAYLLYFRGPSLPTSDNIDEFPLARYAAQYWTQHARMAGKDTNRTGLLSMELFQPKGDAYINWIRLFDPDMPGNGPDMTKSLESVPSPLYYASLEGLIELARQLLDKGADVNAQGGRYGNALQAASARGHDAIVQRLLDKEADVNAQGGYFGNALYAASDRGHDAIVQRLLKARAVQSQ